MSARVVVTAAVLTFLGCAGPEQPAQTFTVRDSAGVRIVENVGSEGRVSGWSLSAEPIFRVGWSEDGPQFDGITDGAILTDGRVVVSEAQRVLRLDGEGDVVWSAGQSGEGPGEYSRLEAVLPLGGDTLLAQDLFGQGLVTYVGDSLLSDRRIEWVWSNSFRGLLGRDASGQVVLAPKWFSTAPDPGAWIAFDVVRTLDFETFDTVAMVDMVDPGERGEMNPLSYWGLLAFTGRSVAYARTDRPEVWWVDADGVRQIARWDATSFEAGDAQWQLYEEGYRRSTNTEDGGDPESERRLAEMKDAYGGTWPYFGSIVGDAGGNIWVSEFRHGGTPVRQIDVVSADGVWLGSVDVPPGLRILDITDDLLLGVELNEWDVQAVALYRIIKP